MDKLAATVKGSSLVEVLVSMVIIVIVVSIVMMILLNISSSASPGILILANQQSQSIIEEIRSSKAFLDEEIMIEGLRITKQVDGYSRYQDLAIVTIIVYDVKDRVLLNRKVLVEIK